MTELNAKSKKTAKDAKPPAWQRVFGFVLVLLAVFPVLSLFSYSWQDVPWLHAETGRVTQNLIGLAGAYGAFGAYSLFGLAAWMIPAWMVLFGVLLLLARLRHPWWRLFWAFLFQLGLCSLFELGSFAEAKAALNLKSAGGALGWFVMTEFLHPFAGPVGAVLIMLVVMLFAVVFGVGWGNWCSFFAYVHDRMEARRSRLASEEERLELEKRKLDKQLEAERREQEKADRIARREQEREERERLKEERARQKEEERAAREAEKAEREREAAEREAAFREEAERRRQEQEEQRQREEEERKQREEAEKAAALEREKAAREAEAVERLRREQEEQRRRDEAAKAAQAASVNASRTTFDSLADEVAKAAARQAQPAPAPVAPPEPERPYVLPTIDILTPLPTSDAVVGDIDQKAAELVTTFRDSKLEVEVTHIETGPVVTTYEVLPAPGIRPEKIASMAKTIEMRLKATSVRIEAPIPGKGVCGIELPNEKARSVSVREVLEGDTWKAAAAKMHLPMLLGVDSSGHDLICDLASMPHMLVAGSTGSGKSVCMNSILTGLLMSRTPEDLRLMLVDPKVVEFAGYRDIPHLVVPVITDPKKVSLGLVWTIHEMEKRYKLLAKAGVKNIESFNKRKITVSADLFGGMDDATLGKIAPDGLPQKLPYIVIVIDELADLMIQVGREIEDSISRLAAKARAVGIHLILATQRPTTDVVTGTIKANIPGRIAFKVAAAVDSRTILDCIGAESLIGKGDMLLLNPRAIKITRAQGAFIGDEDAESVADYIRRQGPPRYMQEVQQALDEGDKEEEAPASPRGGGRRSAPAPEPEEDEPEYDGGEGDYDPNDDSDEGLYKRCLDVVKRTRRASTSTLQRILGIGYNRAARMMDMLEERGVVGPGRGAKPREILIDLEGEIPVNEDGGASQPAGGTESPDSSPDAPPPYDGGDF